MELEQREGEFAILNSQIQDLEHRFRILQDEKNRIEIEAKNQEVIQIRKNENFKNEVQHLHVLLESAERDLRDKSSGLSTQKALVENRSVDINRLRKLVADLDEEGIRIQRTKVALQLELQAARDAHRLAEQGINRREEDAEMLKRSKGVEEARLRNASAEADELSRRLADLQTAVDSVERQCAQKDKDVIEMAQARRFAQEEVDSLSLKNNRLQDEKTALLTKIKDLDVQSRLENRKLDDMAVLIDVKEKEIKGMRASSTYAESKEMATRQDLRKLQSENENFQLLLDKYRNDADLQKRLRDEESLRKYQLEEDKKRLSREALVKGLEAQTAKKELEKYKGSHSQLLQEQVMASQELEAVKEHANLLESQNFNVLFLP